MTSTAVLGAWVRQARKARGLTLEQVAIKAGTGIRFLSEFERGKDTAELGKAMSVLYSLGLTLLAADCTALPDAVPTNASPVLPASTVPLHPIPPPAQTPLSPRPPAGGDAGRFWDMLRAVLDIQDVLANFTGEADFIASVAARRAVERCFDVLGEAARRVTPATQFRFTHIPWREIIARRNSLVMDYEKADAAVLYSAARTELPRLASSLRAMLAESGWR